jgi:hypothetical protein
MSKGKTTNSKKADVLQGTLDLMILKTLQASGRCTASALPGVSNK